MEKPWHKNYPDNVSREVDINRHHSVVEVFDKAVESYNELIAFQSFGKELTYQNIKTLSDNFGAYLQNELGVKKGDRVAVMCPNTFTFAISMWAIIRIGAVQVSVNPLYSAHELQHQLKDADVENIIIFSASTPVLAEIIESSPIKNVIVSGIDDLVNLNLPSTPTDPRLQNTISFVDALNHGAEHEITTPQLSHTDLIFLQYTGGTTGLSKGAMLSHGNIIANLLQYNQVTQNYLEKGKETVMTAIPMYHIFALTVNTLASFNLGAKNILIANPRDMPSFVKTWQTSQATFFTGVNTLFNGLIHTPGFDEIDFSSLKLTVGGGAPVQDAVSNKWESITGTSIYEGYGLSETAPIVSLNHPTSNGYISGIGYPVPSTDVSIRDDDNNVVADGESGELCVSGPQVMQGYWRNQKATDECMTPDNYFKTGDIALLDEHGAFHIVDRKKDMILVSGFNVFPNEIEDVVSNMEGILESACIGVKNEKTGESPKLFAVKTDSSVTAEEVANFCKERLAAYKIPREIVFIDELPKSTVGKLLRRELRNY
ncbi:MAG: AMP-binding protein [Kangiellaceae bacterium]